MKTPKRRLLILVAERVDLRNARSAVKKYHLCYFDSVVKRYVAEIVLRPQVCSDATCGDTTGCYWDVAGDAAAAIMRPGK